MIRNTLAAAFSEGCATVGPSHMKRPLEQNVSSTLQLDSFATVKSEHGGPDELKRPRPYDPTGNGSTNEGSMQLAGAGSGGKEDATLCRGRCLRFFGAGTPPKLFRPRSSYFVLGIGLPSRGRVPKPTDALVPVKSRQ